MTNLNQNGRSMIEMLGVLAIIGVLSVGGIAGYSKAMMKFRVNKTIDQIAMTVTNIRTLYAQQSTYQGLETNLAYKMGLVDDAMVGANSGTLVNPFGGAVTIGTSATGTDELGQATGAFTLKFEKLPREACVAIATNDWGSRYSSGLLGLGINTATTNCKVTSGASTGGLVCTYDKSDNGAIMAVSQAATSCNSATENYIELKYY